MTQGIQPHNAKTDSTWDAGGQHYDDISHTITDSIEHCLTRLAPTPRERILDVATGTGWAARRLVALGAIVTAIDLGTDLIGAAESIACKKAFKIYHYSALFSSQEKQRMH